jgi:predicted small secreted protein
MTTTRQKAALAALALILAGGALTACNTVRGAGQDVEAGGRAIEDAAEDVQDEIEN